MMLGLWLLAVSASFARSERPPPALKLVWQAPGAGVETVFVNDRGQASLVSLVFTGTMRALVRADPVSGRILWQTNVAPGVGWDSFKVLGDDIIVHGQPIGGAEGVGTVAVVSLTTGERRFMRQVTDGVSLKFGVGGGLFLSGECGIVLLDESGRELATLPGVPNGLGLAPRCDLLPRVLGEAAGRSVVLVPQAGSRWRMDAVSAAGTGWTVALGVIDGVPEADWRSGTIGYASAEGEVVARYDLGDGHLAWRSVLSTRDGPVRVRPVDGPLGAPALLAQGPSTVELIDPHDGATLWTVGHVGGDAVMAGERVGPGDLCGRGSSPCRVVWFDARGGQTGQSVLDAGSPAEAIAGGVLVRGAGSLQRLDQHGAVLWTVPVMTPRWTAFDDLVVAVANEGEADEREVLDLATGKVLGTFSGGEPVGELVGAGPGGSDILYVQGTALVACAVKIR